MTQTKIYTDGACSGNPGKGGWAFAIVENDNIIYSENGDADLTTNNKMELTAIINALTYITAKSPLTKQVAIHTDSSYCMNSMTTWVHGWKKKGWKKADGKTIENLELIKTLYKYCHESDLNVSWVKVKAHQKKNSPHYDKYNDFVDGLATENT